MEETRSAAQEAAEDIFFGQLVIIVARWFLILAGTVLVLWTATDPVQLRTAILPVVMLIAMNFYLHGRYLMERPANQALIMAAGLLDLSIITALVILGPAERGLGNQFFVFYYPVILAIAFVFPRAVSVSYTVLAIVAYTVACLLVDPSFIASSRDLEILVQRLTILAAVGLLGTYYWRIQRDRRRAAARPPGPVSLESRG